MTRGLGRFLPRTATPAAQTRPARERALGEARSLATFESQFQASAWGYTGYRCAWTIPAAWRASTLLADLIGTLPVDGYRRQAGKPPVLLDPAPALLANPVPGRTPVEVMASWVLDYLFHGNAVGVVTARDSYGWPSAIVPVPAEWVSVQALDNLSPSDLAVLGGSVVYRVTGIPQVLGPVDMFHVRGPCSPGALRGVGVLEASLETFDLAREQRTQAAALAEHGVPTGLLKAADPDVTPEELSAGKTSWLSAQATRTIAALPPGVDFTPISWNPEELELVEARRMSTQDIALLFGLPGSLLNVESGSWNYSNVGQDGLNLLKFTVNQILVRFEQELTRHLPRGTHAKFDRDAILETDVTSRYAAYATALSAGFLTVDEVRLEEGLPPLPEPVQPPAPPAPPVGLMPDQTADPVEES